LEAGGPSWIQGGFFMKWNKAGGHIFLCCFGSFPGIEERLRRFIYNAESVQSALYDPYTLYVIILDELHSKLDSIMWDLISVFNYQEEVFNFSSDQARYSADFQSTANIQMCRGTGETINRARSKLRTSSQIGKDRYPLERSL
jgi:hypothetical protein